MASWGSPRSHPGSPGSLLGCSWAPGELPGEPGGLKCCETIVFSRFFEVPGGARNREAGLRGEIVPCVGPGGVARGD